MSSSLVLEENSFKLSNYMQEAIEGVDYPSEEEILSAQDELTSKVQEISEKVFSLITILLRDKGKLQKQLSEDNLRDESKTLIESASSYLELEWLRKKVEEGTAINLKTSLLSLLKLNNTSLEKVANLLICLGKIKNTSSKVLSGLEDKDIIGLVDNNELVFCGWSLKNETARARKQAEDDNPFPGMVYLSTHENSCKLFCLITNCIGTTLSVDSFVKENAQVLFSLPTDSQGVQVFKNAPFAVTSYLGSFFRNAFCVVANSIGTIFSINYFIQTNVNTIFPPFSLQGRGVSKDVMNKRICAAILPIIRSELPSIYNKMVENHKRVLSQLK
jgi:hypothetical protein